MKIGEALSELKSKKSQLARLIKIRKDTMYVEEDKAPKFEAQELTEQINNMIDEIRKLKIQIIKTNINTNIGDITLQEAIIKIGDLRSHISNYSDLVKYSKEYGLFDTYVDKDKIELKPQISEINIEEKIKSLEKEKVKLDNKIQEANWKTDLV